MAEVFSSFYTSVSEESTTEARLRRVTARKSGEIVESCPPWPSQGGTVMSWSMITLGDFAVTGRVTLGMLFDLSSSVPQPKMGKIVLPPLFRGEFLHCSWHILWAQ